MLNALHPHPHTRLNPKVRGWNQKSPKSLGDTCGGAQGRDTRRRNDAKVFSGPGAGGRSLTHDPEPQRGTAIKILGVPPPHFPSAQRTEFLGPREGHRDSKENHRLPRGLWEMH